MDKKSNDYKNIRIANLCFLFCILFELAGIMTVLFVGTLGAQMVIYGMTFLFAFFMVKKHKEYVIPIEKPRLKTCIHAIMISLCGMPIAMLLNAFASMLSKSGMNESSDITIYPIWLSLLCFAVVPAIVEEYVFRGVILSAMGTVNVKMAILFSSIFFALLHFELGSVSYGFLYGLLFAVVRVSTGNLIYPVLMHFAFNGMNVALAYMHIETFPMWVFILVFLLCIAAFFVLLTMLLRKNPVLVEKSQYRVYRYLTKEGYITTAVCVSILILFLMM